MKARESNWDKTFCVSLFQILLQKHFFLLSREDRQTDASQRVAKTLQLSRIADTVSRCGKRARGTYLTDLCVLRILAISRARLARGHVGRRTAARDARVQRPLGDFWRFKLVFFESGSVSTLGVWLETIKRAYRLGQKAKGTRAHSLSSATLVNDAIGFRICGIYLETRLLSRDILESIHETHIGVPVDSAGTQHGPCSTRRASQSRDTFKPF